MTKYITDPFSLYNMNAAVVELMLIIVVVPSEFNETPASHFDEVC